MGGGYQNMAVNGRKCRLKMERFLLSSVLFLLFVSSCFSQIIPKRKRCAENDCTETICLARAMSRFPGGDHPLQLSFNKGHIIAVKSKAVDENLWEGEVSGQRGYFPANFVKEFKVFVDSPRFEIDTQNPFDDIRDPHEDNFGKRKPEFQQDAEDGKDSKPGEAAGTPPGEVKEGEQVDQPGIPEVNSAVTEDDEVDETELEDDEEDEGEDED